MSCLIFWEISVGCGLSALFLQEPDWQRFRSELPTVEESVFTAEVSGFLARLAKFEARVNASFTSLGDTIAKAESPAGGGPGKAANSQK